MSKYIEFMGHIRRAVNRDIYLWGGGQPLKSLAQLTEQYIRNKETSTANANRVIALWKERKGVYPDAYAADCSGGIIYCLMLAGLASKNFDATADGLMRKCKTIKRSELREGDWVGQKSSSNIFHIGVVDRVDANGQIWIDEWRGRDKGCVCTKIENGAKPWNVFGRPDWVYKADEDNKVITVDPAPLPAEPFKLNRLLKVISPYMRGNDVHEVQRSLIAKGYGCGSTGADGIYGGGTKSAVVKFQKARNLKADGIVGKNTCTELGGKWEGK